MEGRTSETDGEGRCAPAGQHGQRRGRVGAAAGPEIDARHHAVARWLRGATHGVMQLNGERTQAPFGKFGFSPLTRWMRGTGA